MCRNSGEVTTLATAKTPSTTKIKRKMLLKVLRMSCASVIMEDFYKILAKCTVTGVTAGAFPA